MGPHRETSGTRSRVDDDGLAYRGSMLQLQLYVNERPQVLKAAILAALPSLSELQPQIEWVSPLRNDRYAEYSDAAFLQRLGIEQLTDQLGAFWPRGGPRWDGLARVLPPDGTPGVLLVEAKSYPAEMYDRRGSTASPASRTRIERSLMQVQQALGSNAPVEAWLGPLYQTANRLAHLQFLREHLDNRAWLVHLLITDDPLHHPTGEATWLKELDRASDELGLPETPPNYGHIFLPGLERTEPGVAVSS